MAHKNTNSRYKFREVRQEELRAKLVAGGHIQHVLDILDKIGNAHHEMTTFELKRNEVVINTKLKLIDKYLPNLKAVEMTADITSDVTHKMGVDEANAICKEYGIDVNKI
jgi:hypothetical protein